jgi:FkbH-like protein
MYEIEANTRVESADQLPPEVLAAFGGLQNKLLKRTVLPWSEHCTECVWPSCYSSCDLYSPRDDGKCRRFVDGMVRINFPDALNQYLLKIRFKQWGKLWTPANVRLRSVQKAMSIERWDNRLGTALYQFPLPAPIRQTLSGKRYSFKKRMALRAGMTEEVPTSFLIECFNPLDQTVALSLTMRSFDAAQKIPFQRLIDLNPGFQTIRVPFAEIARVIAVNAPFHIEMIPNDIGQEVILYFGLMEFVEEVLLPTVESKKVKCVVWDLDNTLWDGILVEDGPANIRLKPEIVSILRELDRRGILHSIASKNNYEEAIHALKKFQIDDLFLCPQIAWGPKGGALGAISSQLNIGMDSLLFVDDSEFELQEVKASCPEVIVLNARDYASIPSIRGCQGPVTAESMERRKMYQVERLRQEVAKNFREDYKAFLRDCDIRLEIAPLMEENLERVHELAQRTNQMNFSGNRYDRDVLRKVLQTSFLDTYVLSCEDRFGRYGIVGFGIVDNREPRLTDLMFSCRVQSKRVEHAFLGFILRKYIVTTGRDFLANYRKTTRNAPSGQVFSDLGMREFTVRDGITELVFCKEKEVLDDGIIKISVRESVHSVG